MSNIPAVLVTGVSGRMGQMLVKLINKSDKLRLAGVTERKGHGWIGLDLGEMLVSRLLLLLPLTTAQTADIKKVYVLLKSILF